jgi:hypothetical protein
LTDNTKTPVSDASHKPAPTAAPRVDMSQARGSLLSAFLVVALVISVGVGIWLLQPGQIPEGRPIGQAGNVQAFAYPIGSSTEGFTLWRNGRKTFEFNDTKSGIQRVEFSSNDVDIVGSSDPELVLYTWSGGAHCCFSQIVIDGHSGRRVGTLNLGNGDPTPFIQSKTKGLARAVVINVDDVTAFKFGSYADSPMARIIAIWNGQRFSLDAKRMKAPTADSPPAFFINEPELGEAASIGVQDYGVDEDNPAPVQTISVNARGDRAKTYRTWMEGEEARMRATTLVAEDVTSYGPMAAFLNERIYKGQGVAGIQTVRDAYATDPQTREAALAYYVSVISQSRWFDDLDRLNGGALKSLVPK